MLDQSEDENDIEDEFSKPVESIMRCEDFKSNFARKLSNRYISWAPAKPKNEPILKLCPTEKQIDKIDVPERIEQCSQLSTSSILDQSGEVVKPPNKSFKSNDIRCTEVNAVNMEVDTLRWQLAQTEANRQMHIALLKQIVTFLNRIKEHIECQKIEAISNEENGISRNVQNSFKMSDLPRSKSVFHVDKNTEYSINPTKKISTRKSKSICNVNGYKDYHNAWNQSKLPIISENEISHKLTEEMSRFITLANTVLSTKIPDLACAVPANDTDYYMKLIKEIKIVDTVQNQINDTENTVIKNSELKVSNEEKKDICQNNLLNVLSTQATLKSEVRCNDEESNCEIKDSQTRLTISDEKSFVMERKTDYDSVPNFIEDESGFSSLNSFQEIGIPIISTTPPSPNKEMTYMDEFPDIINETEKWKTDSIEFDKQSVKVFWV